MDAEAGVGRAQQQAQKAWGFWQPSPQKNWERGLEQTVPQKPQEDPSQPTPWFQTPEP